MPRYRAIEMVFVPAPRAIGSEFEYRGWPKMAGLEPVDDEAKQIAAFYKNHKNSGKLPDTPWDTQGRLSLPLLGGPVWRLGPSYKAKVDAAAPEDQILLRAIGWSVMGQNRQLHSAFLSDRWPADDEDVIPANPQAEMVVAFAAKHRGPPLSGKCWDDNKHCVIVPHAEAA